METYLFLWSARLLCLKTHRNSKRCGWKIASRLLIYRHLFLLMQNVVIRKSYHSVMRRRSCSEYCFILKKRKQNMGVNYCNNFCLPFVNVKESGLRKTLFKWKLKTFVKRLEIEKVLCALSGGVDSSVAAVLVHRAIGDQLTCIFVDHGLLRKHEADDVMKLFADDLHMNIIKIDAKDRFLSKLKGVSDPEQKRKIIGNEFIYVFDDEADK